MSKLLDAYQITAFPHAIIMPIDIIALEKAIKRAIVVTHLEIKDQSSGCGDSYAIVLVAEVGSDILYCANGHF